MRSTRASAATASSSRGTCDASRARTSSARRPSTWCCDRSDAAPQPAVADADDRRALRDRGARASTTTCASPTRRWRGRWRDAVADALERCSRRGAGRRGLRRVTVRLRLRETRRHRGGPVSRIREIELFLVELPLVRPFRVSFGTSTGKECVLARVRTDDAEGWGECVADDGYPGFSGEWNEGVVDPAARCARAGAAARRRRHDRHGRGSPSLRARQPDGEGDPGRRGARRGAASLGTSLASTSGRTSASVACGVSIGIADTHRRAPRAGRRPSRAGLPADQAQDHAGHRRRAGGGDPRRPPRHPAVGRRQRGVLARRTSSCSARSTRSTS